jgi:hypothetical protein
MKHSLFIEGSALFFTIYIIIFALAFMVIVILASLFTDESRIRHRLIPANLPVQLIIIFICYGEPVTSCYDAGFFYFRSISFLVWLKLPALSW